MTTALNTNGKRTVLAIASHPDDIEFMMAGTLILLKQAGWETHYLNISSGNCGSLVYTGLPLKKMRMKEARNAATLLGAEYHPSLGHDLEVFYDIKTLRRLAAIIREVQPSILLTHSPVDYMEDHTNACRLALSAAFSRCLANFRTIPPRPHYVGEVTVYHGMPHGLRDPLRRRVTPGSFVDTTTVQDLKRSALAAHVSQQDWLDASQRLNSYLQTMDDFGEELGRMSGKFRYAEGWRRHLHYGFCGPETDPLSAALGARHQINLDYERGLETGC